MKRLIPFLLSLCLLGLASLDTQARTYEFSIDEIGSFVQQSINSGDPVSRLVGLNIQERLNAAGIRFVDENLQVSGDTGRLNLRQGCSARAIGQFYWNVTLDKSSKFQFILSALSEPIIASTDIYASVDVNGWVDVTLGARIFGSCLKYASDNFRVYAHVDAVLGFSLIMNLNPEMKVDPITQEVRIKLSPTLSLSGEITSITNKSINFKDSEFLTILSILDPIWKLVIGDTLMGFINTSFNEFLSVDEVNNEYQKILIESQDKLRRKLAESLLSPEEYATWNLGDPVNIEYVLPPFSDKLFKEVTSFIQEYPIRFPVSSDYLEQHRLEVIFYLFTGDVEGIKELLGNSAACELSQGLLRNLQRAPLDPAIPYEASSYADFCTQVTHSYYLGNADMWDGDGYNQEELDKLYEIGLIENWIGQIKTLCENNNAQSGLGGSFLNETRDAKFYEICTLVQSDPTQDAGTFDELVSVISGAWQDLTGSQGSATDQKLVSLQEMLLGIRTICSSSTTNTFADTSLSDQSCAIAQQDSTPVNKDNQLLPDDGTLQETKWSYSSGNQFDIGVLTIKNNIQPIMKRVKYKSVFSVEETITKYNTNGLFGALGWNTETITPEIANLLEQNILVSGLDRNQFYERIDVSRGNGICKLEMRIYKKDAAATNLKPLIAIHGGTWRFRGASYFAMESMISHFTEKGFVVFAPFYRLTGIVDGNVECNNANGDKIRQDIEDAYQWVEQNKATYGASGKTSLFGQSAGAFLSAQLALNHPSSVDRVLMMYPPTDFSELIRLAQDGTIKNANGVRAVLDLFSVDNANDITEEQIQPYNLPNIVMSLSTRPNFYIIHGVRDSVVPASQSNRFCSAFNGAIDDNLINTSGMTNLYEHAYCGNSTNHLVLLKEARHALEACIPGIECLSGSTPAAMQASRTVLTNAYEWLSGIDNILPVAP